ASWPPPPHWMAAQPGKHVSMIDDRWQRNKFKGLTDREECHDGECCAFDASWSAFWGNGGAARELRHGGADRRADRAGQRRDHWAAPALKSARVSPSWCRPPRSPSSCPPAGSPPSPPRAPPRTAMSG